MKNFILAIVLYIISFSYPSLAENIAVNQDKNWCDEKSVLCESYKTNNKIKTDLNLISKAEILTRRHFTYQDDGDTDDWSEYGNQLFKNYNNETWQFFGDCEDLAQTELAFIVLMGGDKSTIGRLIVATDETNLGNHMIAVAKINGDYYVFADAARYGIFLLRETPVYKPILVDWLGDNEGWKKL